MWTTENRARYDRNYLRYLSDLTDAEWALIEPGLPPAKPGGNKRTVNLRDAQSMIFMAGASALMVGNYLTTLNQPVEKDLQMLKDLGLDPSWDSHGFSDQEEGGCGCGKEQCEAETN